MPIANNANEAGLGQFANLRRLAYFAAVVEAGSFTAAADRLGLTKAVVSQQVARLEREFRSTLLTRTTRQVTPTEAGRAFYQRCATILREAGEAFEELGQTASAPSGTLRLTAPLDYGITAVVPATAEFTRRYPLCKVQVSLTDQSLDLMTGEVELAIRVGWLTEQHLQARQVGRFRQILVAPAAWRERMARLRNPEEIAESPFVANAALRDPTHWRFARGKQEQRRVTVRPVVAMDATLAVREAVKAGMGLSVLPDYAITEELASGTLVQVLPTWELPAGGIHAVFPAARFRPAKVRAFVDVLAEQVAARAAMQESGVPRPGRRRVPLTTGPEAARRRVPP